METLKRILVTIIFLPVVYIGLADNFYHGLYFALGVIIIGFWAYFELRKIFLQIGLSHTFLIPFGLAVIYGSFFYRDFGVLTDLGILIFVGESAYWIFKGKDFQKILMNILSGVFILFYLGMMWGCTILLREWNGGDFFSENSNVLGALHFVLLVTGTWMCDIGAYFGGRWFGKTKLQLPISPNKTLEGFISGVVLSLICVWGVSAMVGLPFHLTMIWIPFAGIIGDLFESLMKRAAGVKDSGHLIPGHGGILDVFDALIFTAPVYYFCILPWIEV